MAKRTKAYAEKKAKLANPNYYVSRTRLCVRNLPTSVDEKRLRGVFQHAAATTSAKVVQVCRLSWYCYSHINNAKTGIIGGN